MCNKKIYGRDKFLHCNAKIYKEVLKHENKY